MARLSPYSNFLPFIDNLITSFKDAQSKDFGKQLNVDSNIIRTNITANDQRQAEIDLQQAAAQGARSDIDLDQFKTIMGSGTSQQDYVQKYLQGQEGRDFQNPNSLSPNAIMAGIGLFAVLFVGIVIVMIFKKDKTVTRR